MVVVQPGVEHLLPFDGAARLVEAPWRQAEVWALMLRSTWGAHASKGSRNACTSLPAGPSVDSASARPHCSACGASISSPRPIIRMARAPPTSWHRSGPPPHADEMARRAWMKPMRAWLACMRMSHARASSAPPPIASPFRYASTGTGQVRTASSATRDCSAMSIVADASRTEDSSTRSPPAAKNRSPAPVRTIKRVSGRAPAAATACPRSASTPRASALCLRGRSIVIHMAPPARSSTVMSLLGCTLSGLRQVDTCRCYELISSMTRTNVRYLEHKGTTKDKPCGWIRFVQPAEFRPPDQPGKKRHDRCECDGDRARDRHL